MGILDQALAVVDNYRRVTASGIKDLVTNPKDSLTQLAYNAADTANAQIKAMTQGDVSSLLPGGGAASSAGAHVLGTFAGQSAKTFPFSKLDKFMNMEEAGKSAKEIAKETGIWRGSEGKLRYEIPDTGMKLKPGKIGDDGLQTYTVEHPDLVAAYPQIQKVLDEAKIRVDPNSLRSGSVNPKTLKMEVKAPDTSSAGTATAHELQHVIQETENFSKGGNPKMFDPAYKDRFAAIDFNIAPEELLKAESLTPYQAYLRISGEAEARAVETQLTKALNGTPGNPLDSFDIPFDKMIQLPR